MWATLRLFFCAALGLCLSACAEPKAPPKSEAIWIVGSDGTPVHRPSGIRLPQQADRFHKTDERMGEFSDVVAFYATSEPGAVLVNFGGILPGAPRDTCDKSVDRRANDADGKVWHKQRLGPWRDLPSLFAGMETGRAASYDSEQRVDGSVRPMRSEIYILCGTAGAWLVEYEANYPRDVDGASWIDELIAAIAPD